MIFVPGVQPYHIYYLVTLLSRNRLPLKTDGGYSDTVLASTCDLSTAKRNNTALTKNCEC